MALRRRLIRMVDHPDYNTLCDMYVDETRLADDWDDVTCKGCQARVRMTAHKAQRGWRPPDEDGIKVLEFLSAPPHVIAVARECAKEYEQFLTEADEKVDRIMNKYTDAFPPGFEPGRA